MSRPHRALCGRGALRTREALRIGQAGLIAALLAAVSIPGAGAEEAFKGGRVLATVGGEAITIAEFEREMQRRSGVMPGHFATLEHRRELLDELVRDTALELAARRDGYAEHPDVQKILRQAMVSKYVDDHLDSLLAEAAVSEADIERHYREHADDYRVAERVRGAIILIEIPRNATQEALVELEKKAAAIREEAARAADDREFAALARRRSDDRATRYLGGNIGWITSGGRSLKWGDEVVEALLALGGPGEIGPVVRGENGFYVVRLIEREAARVRPLEQVRAGIGHRLLKERRDRLREEFYAGLLQSLEVAQNNELLESVEGPPGAHRPLEPPPLPGRPDREDTSGEAESSRVAETQRKEGP